MASLYLTGRALRDLDEIDRFSRERWGERIAEQYLADLEAGLARLAEDLSLFRPHPDHVGRLLFYRVRKHVFVGDVIEGVGFVLTVWHGAMDFLERLSELEPQLVGEAEFLATRIKGEGKG